MREDPLDDGGVLDRRQHGHASAATKRHLLTDGGGVPIALVITAANTPDKAA